jgi:hypothetical protein
MVQAMIDIPESANRVLNIVKAQFGLKDKSAAIAHVVLAYKMEFLEPELKPSFIRRMKRLEKSKTIRYKSFSDLVRDLERP